MKHFCCFFDWFTREKITLLIASVTLVLGGIFPWYRLPTDALEAFGTNLFWTNTGRIFAFLFSIICLAFTFRLNLINWAFRLSFWGGLIACLLFPYLLTTWSPTVTFLAASYFDQQTRVGSHVGENFPNVQAQWKQNVSLDTPQPIRSIFDFDIKDRRFFQVSSWDSLLQEGFGYSNVFLGFIGRGWAFTIIGLIIALIAFYLGLADENLNLFLKDMNKLLPWVGLGLVILVFSLILPNTINHQLDTQFAKGQYQQVLTTSKTLASWYPPLRGDEEFLKRMAEASFYSNQPDPALLYFAKGIERYRQGNFWQAEDYFQKSLAIQPKQFLVRGYLATSILNQGVTYFNDSGNRKPGLAIDRCRQALRIFPAHMEALYDLMLASVVNGEFEKSGLAAQEILNTQKYFQIPSIGLQGQAYLHSAWASYHKGDLTEAWQNYRQSVDPTTWKKSANPEASLPFINDEVAP